MPLKPSRAAIALGMLCLSACGVDGQAPTAEQDREMDRAADMLDNAADNLAEVDSSGLEQELNAAVEPRSE